jgi:hypothetical protein
MLLAWKGIAAIAAPTFRAFRSQSLRSALP